LITGMILLFIIWEDLKTKISKISIKEILLSLMIYI